MTRAPLEDQLASLAACGVRLLEDATVESLLEEHSRGRYEAQPYRLLLCALGSDEAQRCANLWHFDTECIEDAGSYARIAERLAGMAGGDLPLADIADEVDLEAGRASLSFTLDGKPYHWACAVDSWPTTAPGSRS